MSHRLIAQAVLALASLLLMTACGPSFKTTYHFTLPDSQRGRECVNRCQATLQQCEGNATYAHEQCENRAEQAYQRCEARKTYEADPKKGWKKPICVENCVRCKRPYCAPLNTRKCDKRYRQCFETCGGVVDKRVTCTANCDAR